MPNSKMHNTEVEINVSIVRRLLETQFPQWADFRVEPVRSAGTDNALYRLGDDMVVRLPRISWVVEQVDKEQTWLPKLAPHLPLAIPTPLGKGMPDKHYPFQWSIYRWIEGENATLESIADPIQMAVELAHFIAALQQIDTIAGPLPGSHNFSRGVPLAVRDSPTRAAIASLDGMIDTDAAIAAWESALLTPVWNSPPVWIHGDLQSGNLLAKQGQLSAVIDFGGLGIGDPACDMQVAWNLLPAEARNVFRKVLQVDDETWARGRGWALSVGLIALPYYQHTNPVLAEIARHAINEVLAAFRHES